MALALHNVAGHAIYCRAPPMVEQCLVANLLRDTGLGCGQYDPSGESVVSMGRGEVETFISTDGHVTNWHFDFQENFTIQLSGIKRWTIQQGTIRDPLRGCTPHYASPDAVESQLKAANLCDRKFQFGYPLQGVNAVGEEAVVDIRPGDVLYFPAGMWHKVETIEPGVSINVSLMATNYASIACQAIQHFLLKDPRWRQPILNNSVHDAMTTFRELLQELPDRIQILQSKASVEAILPPVLRYPPMFEVDDEEEWEDTSDDHGQENHDAAMADVPTEEKKEDNAQGDQEGSLEEEADPILDPVNFEDYPQGWSFDFEEGLYTKYLFVKNPLATLHRIDEVTGFYVVGNGNGQPREDPAFLLNINYAGNEMHQSAVRVKFWDDANGTVNSLHMTTELQDQRGPFVVMLTEQNCEAIKFLVYHGYLQRV